MRPPLIANENGDFTFFASIEAMKGYIEAIDVKNNEYEFFDAEGNEIVCKLTKKQKSNQKIFFGLISVVDCERVHFELNGKNNAKKLKNALLHFNNRYIKININPSWNIEQIINTLVNSSKVDYIC
ncbi:MAG: hypothetical protein LBP54_04250 [Campylobacteraceae bacterium]|jgi:hypothetical protein|nr:hypothetical protein [Campylobacteraceae bacterium]